MKILLIVLSMLIIYSISAQTETQGATKFKQLYQELPTPSNYRNAAGAQSALRWAFQLKPWAMAEIFMVGVAVALVKEHRRGHVGLLPHQGQVPAAPAGGDVRHRLGLLEPDFRLNPVETNHRDGGLMKASGL